MALSLQNAQNPLHFAHQMMKSDLALVLLHGVTHPLAFASAFETRFGSGVDNSYS
jgi:hypothetical protein